MINDSAPILVELGLTLLQIIDVVSGSLVLCVCGMVFTLQSVFSISVFQFNVCIEAVGDL